MEPSTPSADPEPLGGAHLATELGDVSPCAVVAWFLEANRSLDVDAVFEEIAPEARWVSPAAPAGAPRGVSGKQANRRFFEGIRPMWRRFDLTFVDVHPLADDPHRVVAHYASTGTLIDGSPYANTDLSLVMVDEGRIVEWVEFCDRGPLERAVGSSAPPGSAQTFGRRRPMSETHVEGKAAASGRPEWVSAALFPYQGHFIDVEGSRLHYVDEGEGPVMLLLQGNPTWSFLYRHVIGGLRHRFRGFALDLPGFGLSSPAPGYRFTPAEHAGVVERFVTELALSSFTPVVHDWSGPIGLAVAGRHSERVGALVICNTFAWPTGGDRHFEWFSKVMGGPVGRLAIRRLNAFVNVIVPAGTRRQLFRAGMAHYRRPFPTPDDRTPTHVPERDARQP